jgi:hypothetical protein
VEERRGRRETTGCIPEASNESGGEQRTKRRKVTHTKLLNPAE